MICNLRLLRTDFGYSQVKLAFESGVSLPTIQNIESGKANPTIEILEKLLNALGFEATISVLPFDISTACELGVPLSHDTVFDPSRASKEKLMKEAKKWANLLHLKKLSEREEEALISFFMAIRDAFPTLFKSKFNYPFLTEKLKFHEKNGRVIKLRRISISATSRYL